MVMLPIASNADDSIENLTLKDTIEMAIDANLNLKQSREEIKAAEETRKASITRFLPTFSASYDYLHRNKELTQELTGIGPSPEFVVRPDDQYTFVTSFNQPIFSGFSLINQYKVADLGLDAAEFSEKVTSPFSGVYFTALPNRLIIAVFKSSLSPIIVG